jgi:hypothetical protein
MHNQLSIGEKPVNIQLALICSIIAPAMAADLPYSGKWKVNLGKSDFGETTMTLESLPGGEWRDTAMGITYTFKMDGKDYPDGMGGTAAWKSVGADTWELEGKANGKVRETDSFKLGADGKTLTDVAKSSKADGGVMENTIVYERVSGGPSLAGKWKTRKVSGTAGMIEMVASGGNGLVFKDLDMGMTCDARLDGKDYPCTGPTLPPGLTVAIQNAARSLDVTGKKDGKPLFKANFTVAADGKAMTETSTAASDGERFKIFFDRM